MNSNEESEEDTKAEYISPALRKSGWYDGKNVKMEFPDGQAKHKPYSYTNGRINQFTGQHSQPRECRHNRRLDYLLYYPNIYHKIAVIEAKDITKQDGTGLEQGEDYARDLDIPFVFTSNGKNFVFEDMTDKGGGNEKISLDNFPTPQRLWKWYCEDMGLTTPKQSRIAKSLYSSRYFYRPGSSLKPRYYQTNAINKTLEAIAKGKRHIMFVMATGTGKTYTAFQIAWCLNHNNNLPHRIYNVLYLVDRKALLKQPKDKEFSHFGNATKEINRKLLDNWKTDSAYTIYFGLYQRLFAHNPAKNKQFMYENIPRNTFDLIIVDEAHRSSAYENGDWHQILNYFSPIKSNGKTNTIVIGMTATPNRNKDANPKYFGKPVYKYNLKQGINDGFLAPYKVIHVNTNLDVNGFVPKEHELDANGKEIPHRKYIGTDFNRNIDIASQTKESAKIISDYLKKNHMRDAKTLIFCASIQHAREMMLALKNENKDLVRKYNRVNENYVTQITSGVDNAYDELDSFERTDKKTPTLVTTSDMLRTGVNAKDIKLIVFDVQVNSSIEFKQMIGRGTRLDTKNGKSTFTIMDFGNNVRKFHDPEFEGKPVEDNQIKADFKAKSNNKYIPPTDYGHTNSKQKTSNTNKQPKHYMYRVDRNVKVDLHDSQVYYLDENGKVIPSSLLRYSKDRIISVFHNPKMFRNAWQKATWKTDLLNRLKPHRALLDLIRKQNPKLKQYDYFDMIVHLAYDQKPLTKQERVNHVEKRGILYKYKGNMRAILKELLDDFQNQPYFDVNDIEDAKTLRSPKIKEQFGSLYHIVNVDFGGPSHYSRAIHGIVNALYN